MLKKITLSISMICSLSAASEQETYLSMQDAVVQNIEILKIAENFYAENYKDPQSNREQKLDSFYKRLDVQGVINVLEGKIDCYSDSEDEFNIPSFALYSNED